MLLSEKSVLEPTLNDRGMVLISTMLILVLITIIGLSAMNTSTTEIKIAGNDKSSRMAFYLADGGAYSTAKLISETLDSAAMISYTGLTYVEATAGDFYRKLMGFIPNDNTTDAELVTSAGTLEIDIRSREAKSMVGGGAEFASGTAGAGVGSSGGTYVLYLTQTAGIAVNNSSSMVESRYRKVLGTAGGL